jgi:dinuclear metal center YbgI/SA1388 family protein
MTVKELYIALESQLPPLEIEGIDSDGVHTMPAPEREVKKVLVALDPYEKAVKAVIDGGYDLLLTHHPLFWGEPIPNTPPERWYNMLMEAKIASFSFHIRLDKAVGGVNDILANELELANIKPFDDPEIAEIGRMGDLKYEMTEVELAEFVKSKLDADSVTYTRLPDGRRIKKVAVLGGSASDAISSAALAGADAIVGGEFKHHTYGYAAVEANGRGIALIEAGHYHTEYPVCERLRELVLEAIPDAQVDILPCNNTFVI